MQFLSNSQFERNPTNVYLTTIYSGLVAGVVVRISWIRVCFVNDPLAGVV